MKADRLILIALFAVLSNLALHSQVQSIVIANISRNFKLHVPKSYNASIKIPLVIVLHDYDNNVNETGDYTGFDNMSEKAGFIAVYPEGTLNEIGYYIWNAGNKYEDWTNGAKDVEFIDSLINYIAQNFAVDKQRVYIAGYANGSMMAYRLAAELSDKIAAVACVSGSMANEKVKPSTPVAIMHIHGDNDIVMPHTGTVSSGFKVNAIDAIMKKWIEWDSCSTVPSILKYDPKVTALLWNGKAEVRLYLLHNVGHDWPSEERGGWPATDYIWEFFKPIKKNYTR